MRPREMRRSVGAGCLAASCLAMGVTAGRVHAQDAWDGRARLGVNGLVQAATPQFAQTTTLTKNAEPTPVSASSPRASMAGIDVNGAVRVWHNVGASVAVSYVSGAADASVTAQIPHPFYFDQPRTVSGTLSNVAHSELASHIDGALLVPHARLDIMVMAGLSILRLSQELVSDVTVADAYPYDTARFVDATKARATATAAGVNAGVDVAWKLSRVWGLGALVRYTHASAPLTLDGRSAGTRKAGGLQMGAGLRVRF